ncbi:MAG: phosphopyruvate hydratase [Candidatus Diapherotrites archaeon]|nr:phosphopyruvate hydratase [Candidatus Diapherotrites archaeon]
MVRKYEIIGLDARQVFDSRGNPTIECTVNVGKGAGSARVPSGASTGKHEAIELRDGGKEYNGKGVSKAIANINKIIAPQLIGMDVRGQEEIDKILIELDGTPNKSRLGANATTAVSLACCRAAANAKQIGLYHHIGSISHEWEFKVPVPFFNIINGGVHSGSKLAVQEFMLAPKTKSFAKAMEVGVEVYHELGEMLKKKYGKSATNVGDEGGFAPPISKTEEAIKLILKAVKASGHEDEAYLSLDVAASEIFKKGKYHIDGKALSADGLLKFYEKLIQNYPIMNIEDPFYEEDFKEFAKMTDAMDIQVTGDDIFVTNVERIKHGIQVRACNALLLKVNQIGTLTEAIQAAKMAQQSDYRIMVSHRSGETSDPFIADLAVGIGAEQIKSGAPCRSERLAKYNRLLEIEREGVSYVGWFQ